MMSLHYSLVFGLLLTEMVLFLIFLIPFPLKWRNAALEFIHHSTFMMHLQNFIRFFFLGVLILFLDSLNSALYPQTKTIAGKTTAQDATQEKLKMFFAQRNLYLTGATLFLFIVLDRFIRVSYRLAVSQQRVYELESNLPMEKKDEIMVDAGKTGEGVIPLYRVASQGTKKIQ